ncbi:MAG: Uma2 family endonuclease [Defluviitaleaceae bacterium]|nr:Uma2 family endonuclease [Defluviitaleaceae bacterium]
MIFYQDMAVYPRHGDILERISNILSFAYFDRLVNREIILYRENNALAYRGTFGCFEKYPPFELYNVNAEPLPLDTLRESGYIQPDYMLFQNNKLQQHESTYKMAGCPDLAIEVWSKNSSEEDRTILSKLYATSQITEFWQIEQDSNEIKCSIGKTFLPDQNLKTPLKTQGGLVLDLTSIAL